MGQLGSHWMDLNEIWFFGIFRKSVEKNQVSLKADEHNAYCASLYIYDSISLTSSKKVVKKITTIVPFMR